MLKISLVSAAAILGTALSVAAQSCAGAPLPQTFSNRPDFGASFYYNMANHFFDLDLQVPITLSGARTWTYDQGVGNPVVPNQVGATGVVEVYTCATTTVGNRATAPGTPGLPWTLVGTGTITVVNTGSATLPFPGESPIVFTPPIALPAGQIGVAFRYLPTTTGPNPGPLHCLGVSPNPALPVSDQFLTFSNDAIQGVAWTGVGQDSPNLRLIYTPAANSAQHVQFGDGCYFRPQAFYQNVPSSPAAPNLANFGMTWVPLGANYLVVPAPAVIVPPISASLTLNPPAFSSSANWDDALAAAATLPFTFNYPGGSTTEVTVCSNGVVYLANVASASYDVCGASYGSILPFRNGPPRVAGYYHDLDPSVSGSVVYDVDPLNQFVRVTWLNVQEWGVAAAVNTIQITLNASGQVDIAYGALGNQSAGNNAIAGFTPGLGARLGPAISIPASVPFQSGDGAIPPVLSMTSRAVLGTSANIVTSNITAGTIFQVLAIFGSGLAVPVDLSIINMSGCFLHASPAALITTLASVIGGGGTFTETLIIPNNPVFQNTQFVMQSFPLTAGLNPANLVNSNGLCVKVGT